MAPPIKRKRYCCVKNCINRFGTLDQSINFFRSPQTFPQRIQWEHAICGKSSERRLLGLVCIQHFKSEDIYTNSKGVSLKQGAIPTNFMSHDDAAEPTDVDASADNMICSEFVECPIEEPPKPEFKVVDIDAIKKQTAAKLAENEHFERSSSKCTNCIQKDVQIEALNMEVESLKAKVFELVAENRKCKDIIERLTTQRNEQINGDMTDRIDEFENMESETSDQSVSESIDDVLKSSVTIDIEEEVADEIIKQIETKDGIDELENVESVTSEKSVTESADDMLKSPVKINIKEKVIEPTIPAVRIVDLSYDQPKQPPVLKFYKCARCDMAFELPLQLKEHIRDEHTIRILFKCDYCDQEYKLASELAVHMRNAHPKIRQIKCNICGMKFDNANDAKNHRRTAHGIQKHFLCYLCKIETESFSELKLHFQRHARDQNCTICKEPFTVNELNKHLCGNRKSVRCEYCRQSFDTTVKLLKHLETHDKKKFYRCEKCKKKLPMITLIKYHKSAHKYDLPKLFTCPTCSKAFSTKHFLNIHKRTHDDRRCYLCDLCGKGFSSSRNLKLHKESSIHVEKPLFQCPECPHACYRRAHLNLHLQNHQNNTFVCEICEAELKSMKSYRKHKRYVHAKKQLEKKHACLYCPMKFDQLRRLKMHQTVHTLERAFSCEYCEKSGQSRSFRYKGDLIKHIRTHMKGGLIYGCSQCKKRFKYHLDLQKHEHEHYKEQRMMREANEVKSLN